MNPAFKPKDESHLPLAEQSLVFRLWKRAQIRRQSTERKSVQEERPDRVADLLEEAAWVIDGLARAGEKAMSASIRDHEELDSLRSRLEAAEARVKDLEWAMAPFARAATVPGFADLPEGWRDAHTLRVLRIIDQADGGGDAPPERA